MSKAVVLLLLLMLSAGALPAQAATLTLAQSLDLARQHNRSLQVADTSQQLAAEQVTEAGSTSLPRIDLNAGYTMQAAPQKFMVAGFSEPSQDRNYAHASIAAEQMLYDFGQSRARVAAARAGAAAGKDDLVALQQAVFLRTTQAYYGILSSRELQATAQEEVKLVTEHLREARVLYDNGVVTRNDVLQAEVRLASSRQLELSRTNQLENAWLSFNDLTGRPDDARADLTPAPAGPLPKPDKGKAVPPEVRAQQERLESSRQAVTEARSGLRPEFFARLGADYVDNSYVKEQTIYQATLGLRVNLFDGQATTSRIRQAVLANSREQQRLDDVRARSALELKQALNDARVASQRLQVAETAIAQAEENLRINRQRYQEQVGTATEVLDAQTLLTRSRTERAVADYDYRIAVARAQRAAGTL